MAAEPIRTRDLIVDGNDETRRDLQRRIAELVLTLPAFDDPDTAARAVDCLVDWVGVAAASADAEVVGLLCGLAGERSAEADPATGTVPVFAATAGQEPLWAARVNGTCGHAQDFDDTHATSLVHVSSAILPALLSALAHRDTTGRDLLAAYAVGIWVCEALSPGAGRALLREGLHPTATLGAIAASAATSRLLGLDADACEAALGLAASSAYGTLTSFGTMAKPLQVGAAAANGLLAALLAGRGVTAGRWQSPRAGNAGPVLRALTGDAVAPAVDAAVSSEVQARRDVRRAIHNVAHKPYAACLLTHTAIDAAIGLAARLERQRPDATVRRVTVRVSDEAIAAAGVPRPQSGYEAKFSLAYCVATALSRGEVPVETFRDAFGSDPAVDALRPRIELEREDAFSSVDSALDVELDDGTHLTAHAASARGQPEQPMTAAEIRAKFAQNVGRRTGVRDANAALSALEALPCADSARSQLRTLWTAMYGGPRTAPVPTTPST